MLRSLARACRAAPLLLGLAVPMAAYADQYDDFAVISSTLGVQDGRVCVGEASRGDIGCPAYAPSVASDGSISATRFVGDGSGLFNIAGASADRIVSGSTSMLAISNTGYISVTQSGVNTAYFHPSMGLVTVGVSSTGGISGTTGYFTGSVGIGTTAPKAALDIGYNSFQMGGEGQYLGFNIYYDAAASSWKTKGSGYSAFIRMGQQSSGEGGDIQFNTGGIASATANTSVSSALRRSLVIRRDGDVRARSLYVGDLALATTPTTSLEVNGTVSATAGYFSGNVNLSNIATVGVSGTIFTVSNSVGSLFTTGNSANYFDIKSEGSVPILRLVKNTTQWSIGFPGSPNATSDPWQRGLWFVPYYTTTGVGATPTLVLENTGAVGIGGITQPSASLEVSGTVSATVLQVANTAPDSACTSTSDLGKMRRNPTTGRMQVCR